MEANCCDMNQNLSLTKLLVFSLTFSLRLLFFLPEYDSSIVVDSFDVTQSTN
ncbi:unnamed protein product, partial [Heterobilharzia americana]